MVLFCYWAVRTVARFHSSEVAWRHLAIQPRTELAILPVDKETIMGYTAQGSVRLHLTPACQ